MRNLDEQIGKEEKQIKKMEADATRLADGSKRLDASTKDGMLKNLKKAISKHCHELSLLKQDRQRLIGTELNCKAENTV